MTTARQRQFDYPTLERSAEVRMERAEEARKVSVQLAAVPAGMVSVGSHRWDQVQRWLFWLVVCGGSNRDAAHHAGLSTKQLERSREIASRLGLIIATVQFTADGKRIDDRIEVDFVAVAELAAAARAAVPRDTVRPRARSPGVPHVRPTCAPPVPQVFPTCSPPVPHPPDAGNNPARARSDHDLNDLNECHSFKSFQEEIGGWGEEDWRAIRPAIAATFKRLGLIRVPDETTVRYILTGWLVYTRALDDQTRFDEMARYAGQRATAPAKYLHVAARNEAIKRGVDYDSLAAWLASQVPHWMLKSTKRSEATTCLD